MKRTRLSRDQVSVTGEADYITGRALDRDARVVSFGQLVFFSTQDGDAWMLDPEDGLARCLARAAEPLPAGIIETPDQFGIEWNSNYRIEGGAFVVIEGAGRVRAIHGYPVADILRASARVRRK